MAILRYFLQYSKTDIILSAANDNGIDAYQFNYMYTDLPAAVESDKVVTLLACSYKCRRLITRLINSVI